MLAKCFEVKASNPLQPRLPHQLNVHRPPLMQFAPDPVATHLFVVDDTRTSCNHADADSEQKAESSLSKQADSQIGQHAGQSSSKL